MGRPVGLDMVRKDEGAKTGRCNDWWSARGQLSTQSGGGSRGGGYGPSNKGSEEVWTGWVRLRLGPLEVTLWQSFPIRLRLSAAHNSVLAGPPLPLRQAASNSLRVAAGKSN